MYYYDIIRNVAVPNLAAERGCRKMATILSLIVSIIASVVAYYQKVPCVTSTEKIPAGDIANLFCICYNVLARRY